MDVRGKVMHPRRVRTLDSRLSIHHPTEASCSRARTRPGNRAHHACPQFTRRSSSPSTPIASITSLVIPSTV
ncbi:unnamed protein product, partial [Iphiclides podalirius]